MTRSPISRKTRNTANAMRDIESIGEGSSLCSKSRIAWSNLVLINLDAEAVVFFVAWLYLDPAFSDELGLFDKF